MNGSLMEAEAYIAAEACNVVGENETAARIMRDLLDEITRLREALERVYQTGRGPHVAIAREVLDA